MKQKNKSYLLKIINKIYQFLHKKHACVCVREREELLRARLMI
jgi:hypothetical protein